MVRDSLRIALKALPSLARNYAGIPSPLFWVGKVTYRCNCRCRFCSIWRRPPGGELGTEGAKSVVRQAAALGAVFATFEGGEPLLRADLPELLREARRCGMVPSVITNGLLLPERMGELEGLADVMTISLDGIGDTHDSTRGVAGAFEGVRAAVSAAKASGGTRVFLNSTVSRSNLHEIEALADFAMRQEVPISFCPVTNFKGAEDLRLDRRELSAFASRVLAIKRKGLPVLNSDAFLHAAISGRRVRCRSGDAYAHTDPDGDLVMPCYMLNGDFRKTPGLEGKPLAEAWNSEAASRLRAEAARCGGCGMLDCVEPSLLLAARLDVLFGMAKAWEKMGRKK